MTSHFPVAPRLGLWAAVFCLLVPALAPLPAEAQTFAIGDTITVIQRPLLNIPTIVRPGDTFPISCAAPVATVGWAAELRQGLKTVPLTLQSSTYDPATLWWTLQATLPAEMVFELYDLRVTAASGIDDVTWNSVQVVPEFRDSYYFVHVTDAHMPDHQFSDSGGVPADSTEIDDMREVIRDINLLNPEFVLLTGDAINEGELEDYLDWRSYSRVQRLLAELEVPVYLIAGNHDIGGWDATPPPDGTARRQWWRFFGWPRLDNPPSGAPYYTQDYSFDYGPVHYTGIEAYNNYDDWRSTIYGSDSFTPAQLAWLQADLAAAAGSQAQVLFFHYDYQYQIDLVSLGAEMSLAGHTHHNDGSLTSQPYELITDNVCDGARSFRVVRVSGSTLLPEPTVQSGSTGGNLRVSYDNGNDGTADQVIATVANTTGERFENGRLRVLMPRPGTYNVSGGTLVQVDLSDPAVAVVHAAVDIPASGTVVVRIDRTVASGVPGLRDAGPRLLPNSPNPFNPSTRIAFSLEGADKVELDVYDLVGRRVRRLAAGPMEAGEHRVLWDGLDDAGHGSPSGIYLVRLKAAGRTLSQRITLAK